MKTQLTGIVVLLVVALTASWAHASIFPESWVQNVLNTYEDQSRESIFDLDHSGGVSVGDVFTGFLRIDTRSVPLPGVSIPSTGKTLYGIFSVEVSSVTATALGAVIPGQTSYDIRFGQVVNPLAVGALDLPSLTGLTIAQLTGFQPGGAPMAAVYEDVPQDYIATAPAGPFALTDSVTLLPRMSIVDFDKAIAAANLDLVLGFTATDPDYYVTWQSSIPAFDTVANLHVLDGLSLSSSVGAKFQAGFSALGGPLAPYLLPSAVSTPLITDDYALGFPYLIPPTPHDLTLTGGEVTGANNLFFGGVNPFFGDGVIGNKLLVNGIAYDVYGVTDNADISLVPIPEAASGAIWSLLIIAGAVCGWIRRRR